MAQLLTMVKKELLLLGRDRGGLLVLFAMPAVLVLVITLVQSNVQKLMGVSLTQVLLVDQDRGGLGREIGAKFAETGNLEVVENLDGHVIDRDQAINAVGLGRFKVAIVIPSGFTEVLNQRVGESVRRGFGEEVITTRPPTPELQVYYDPTVMGGFRMGIQNGLKMIILGFSAKLKMDEFRRILPVELEKQIQAQIDPKFRDMVSVPSLDFTWDNETLVGVTEHGASRHGMTILPTPVQQNVPAWTLFGIFFIVVPLAGALQRERRDGVFTRLLAMPVSGLTILGGKIIAYSMVCLGQFWLILLIGRFLLPALGTSRFVLGSNWPVAVLICLGAAVAASAYGLMLGSLSRSIEQVSMFGSISVVLAAAIGGIMVPVYAMPPLMQSLSAISPLNWGMDAFLDLVVRGGNLKSVALPVGKLLLFAGVNLLVAWGVLFRNR
ncbi:MAG: ABC transporter permease [Proteobacteria bacterium]|nr:ABC transporter permease [Pseudomonadota bacterium]MBU1686391.1 ABC transporter permease [Pseudomonadota bacterium]